MNQRLIGSRIWRSRVRAALLVTMLVPALASAQEAAPSTADAQSLGDLSLEELLGIQVERVFGASRRLQPVTEAPSSVTIVTADEIRRMGYRSLADILRGVRGLYVSYDRNYSYLGARGFSLPGDYNTRVLLLLDGHRLNDNIYDQAGIGPELGVSVSMIERVEIIRGPSSSLYGANAFFGVVNIITRNGASLDGVTVSADAGTLGLRSAGVTAGRVLANGMDVAFGATVEGADGQRNLYIPAFDDASTNNGVAVDLDGEQVGQAFGQIAFKGFTVKSGFGHREKAVPTGAYGAIFNDSRFKTIDQRAFLDLQYQRTVGAFRTDVRTYVDNYHYTGDYPYAEVSEPDSLYHDYADGTWMGVDGRASRTLPWKQTLTFGGEYRNNLRQNQGAYYSDPSAPELFIRQSSANFGAYLQNEVALHEKFLATAGLRYDRYAHFSRVTPRGALIFRPSVNRALKLLFGRAFRAPNAYESDYYSNQGPLGAETIDSQEIVWEEYVSDWLRTSASAYWNDVENLVTLQGEAMHGHLFFTNQGHVHARGVEFEAEIKTKWGLQGLASYGLQRTVDQNTSEAMTNSPRHAFKGRVMFPTGRAGSSIGFELHTLSARKTLSLGAVPRATVANFTIVEPVARSFSLTAQVANLFDQHYADPGSEEHVQDRIEQNGRTLMVGLRWTLGGK